MVNNTEDVINSEYFSTMEKLVQKVIATFYEPHHIAITNILLKNLLLTEEELCSKLKLLSREFNKLSSKLREDRILKCESRNIQSDGVKVKLSTFYFFDFSELRDIFRYKIHMMYKKFQRNENEFVEEYICNTCGQIYSSLDAQSIVKDYEFICSFCNAKLVEYHKTNNVSTISYQQILTSIEDIYELVKNSCKFYIPPVNLLKLELMKNKRVPNSPVLNKEEVINKSESPLIINNVGERNNEMVEEFSHNYLRSAFQEGGEYNKRGEDHKNKEEDILVTVNGEKKFLKNITNEDEENMTDEEYSKYYEMRGNN